MTLGISLFQGTVDIFNWLSGIMIVVPSAMLSKTLGIGTNRLELTMKT